MRNLAFLTSFYNLNATLNIREDFFKSLSKNFKIIYIINSDKLNFFSKFEAKYSFKRSIKDKIYKKLPGNIRMIDLKDGRDFLNFTRKNFS